MTVSDTLARAIMRRLQEQTEITNFSDVTVVVGDTTFECHRFLLSACSDFFRATFTSGMREDLTKRVELKGIAPETFSLVQESLYGARNVLNPDNVNSIWHAASQLQIDFLTENCELFHVKQLCRDNCHEIYINAKLLDSKKLMKSSWELIVKEFDYLRKTDQILMLDIDDMLTLISNDDLKVESEDVVIDALMRWVRFDPEEITAPDNEELFQSHQEQTDSEDDETRSPKKQKPTLVKDSHHITEDTESTDDSETKHKAVPRDVHRRDGEIQTSATQKKDDRKEFLPELLAASKVCLISGPCIQALLEDKMVLENPKAFSIIQEALRYQLQPGKRHDYCPPNAVHRKTSPLQNVTIAITGLANQPKMSCRTSNGSWFQLAAPPAQLLECKAVVYENDIYATSSNATSLKDGFMYKYDSNTNVWQPLPNLIVPRDNHSLICMDDFIYAVGGDNCTEIERFHARDEQRVPGSGRWEQVGNLKLAVSNIFALSHGSSIVVFGNVNDNSTSTTIQCFDTQTMSAHYYVDDMSGPAKGLVGFRVSNNIYVLQKTGALWRVNSCTRSNITMEFCGMLWDFSTELFAATVHNEELLVVGNKADFQMPREWDTTNNALFKRIKIIELEGNCFLNSTIPKTLLTTKEA